MTRSILFDGETTRSEPAVPAAAEASKRVAAAAVNVWTL
jgi:hypothetical protein